MKKDCCYISRDGNTWVDIFDRYGVLVKMGGYNNLLSFPSVKTPKSNDWVEEDYEDVDLSMLHLDSRSVSVSFIAVKADSQYEDFIAELIDARVVYFSPMEASTEIFKLRYKSQSSLEYGSFIEFAITFEEDVPWSEIALVDTPVGTRGVDNNYLLNGSPLSRYNIAVLKGTKKGVERLSEAKSLLTIKNANMDGQIYDTGGRITFGAREVTLYCLMTDSNVASFWNNYTSFFGTLVKERGEDVINKHLLVLGLYGKSRKCYYLKQSVREFFVDKGKVWCRFDISFRLVE